MAKIKVHEVHFNTYSTNEFGLEFTFDNGDCFELQIERGNSPQEVSRRAKMMAERLIEKPTSED